MAEQPAAKRISIVITDAWIGHHPEYLELACDAALTFSDRVYALCPKSDEFEKVLFSERSRTEFCAVVQIPAAHDQSGAVTSASRDHFCAAVTREVTKIRQGLRGGDTVFVFFTGLDWLLCNLLDFPRHFLRIAKALPFGFAGILISPDRVWRFRSLRRRLGCDSESGQQSVLGRLACKILDLAIMRPVAGLLRWAHFHAKTALLKRSNCVAVAILDERYQNRLSKGTGKPVFPIPDPSKVSSTESRGDLLAQVREAKREAPLTVGLLGVLTYRKGIGLLADAVESGELAECAFVVAGRVGDDSESQRAVRKLERACVGNKRLIFSREKIPDAMFNGIVNEVDVLFCAYEDHLHSSGLLVKAALHRKLVIVSSGHLMEKRVRHYNLGLVLPDMTTASVINALKALKDPINQEKMRSAARFDAYARDLSVEKFNSILKDVADSHSTSVPP